ncbi:hypothetical protein EV385_5788 [Krasilnikovia cinnamomea]|uniref:Histidine kinase-like protein n=1 Tax=Krasilnikovia cinnamomea TaxID=349313 RepID=A0A4Q7ZSL9_9ACTN|nr:ATP-binding protein [Krasilnikovia cinnamomea]RZU53854.1 hypothetical protein EV385_5788 [Krasilnikovia cinnamomea]
MRRDQPPFLLSRPDHPGMSGGQVVTVVGDFDTGLVEAAVSGRWDAGLKTTAAGLLRACLVGEPAGVLVDLQGLADPGGASAALWAAARLWGARTPAVPVVVCLPPAAPLAGVLARRDTGWDLPVYASVPEARAALTAGTARLERLVLHLEPDGSVLSLVAEMLGEACTDWGLLPLYRPACAVLTELVANAIEHAGTSIDVAVTRRRAGLHLAVQDGDRRFPRGPGDVRGDPGDPARRGYGLRLVHAATAAWGALPTRTGKIVWGTLAIAEATADRPRQPAARPLAAPRHGSRR